MCEFGLLKRNGFRKFGMSELFLKQWNILNYLFLFYLYLRKMYWADWGRNRPKIEVANMDGSDRRVLVQSPALKVPNGLTLVQSTNELCYCDAGVKEICCVNLGDLSMRKVVRRALYPFGITNFNRTLFWTDWRQGRIQRMGLSAETRDAPLRSFVGSSGKIFDIKAVQPCEKTGRCISMFSFRVY